MNYANTVAQNDMTFSYHPMPFFNDVESKSTFNKKLDLNLYCIKRPQQTCFIRVTNPNMLAWGIEMGDMLVVEKNDSLFIGDLVVLVLHVDVLQPAQQGRPVPEVRIVAARRAGFTGETQAAEVPQPVTQAGVPETSAPQAERAAAPRFGTWSVHGQPSLAMNFSRSTT